MFCNGGVLTILTGLRYTAIFFGKSVQLVDCIGGKNRVEEKATAVSRSRDRASQASC